MGSVFQLLAAAANTIMAEGRGCNKKRKVLTATFDVFNAIYVVGVQKFKQAAKE